jgi:FkbM family methyltransferase
MIKRLARQLLLLLPARWLRWLGRIQFRFPLLRRWGDRISSELLSGAVTVGHGPARGLRITLGGAHPGYALGTSEPVLQQALVDLLRPGNVFYDLGANVGFFTLLAARLVGPSGAVIAFEPDPRNADTLRANVAANGFENVTVVQEGVTERSGTVDFVLAASTASHFATAGQPAAGSTPVRVTSLDDFLGGGAPPPTVVKLDIEGEEVRALRGAGAMLETHRPTIICEVHHTEDGVRETLGAAGYSISLLESSPDEVWNAHLLATPIRSSATA